MPESLRKYDVINLLTTVLENSTILPFRWFSNRFTCFFCRCHFYQAVTFKKHMSDEHSDAKITSNLQQQLKTWKINLDISDITCKICNERQTTYENYLDHVTEAHNIKIKKNLAHNIPIYKLDDEIRCLFCEEKFRLFGILVNHVQSVHCRSDHICEICGRGFTSRRCVENHVRNKHRTTTLKCNECSKVFPNQRTLKYHIDSAHKKQMFRCAKCQENFPSSYKKKKHLAIAHNETSHQFPCDICSKVFTRNQDLVTHKSRVHLKIKALSCETCGFKVFNKDMLRKHQAKHTGVRSYECGVCRKKFIWKNNLEMHMRIHMNDRRFICEVCDKAFVQKTSLKVHMKSHHPKKD